MAASDPTHVEKDRRKGRGALSNRPGRFEPNAREAVDDGWARVDDDLPPIRTEITLERPRKVITRNTSPDLSFDRSVNPYRGCEHGCVYCFARPTHSYLGLSAGLDFETRLTIKPGAPELLAKELSNARYQPKTIAIGTNTDPYQPIEKEHRIMRRILEVLRDFKHPVGIVTKGTLIERDLDILSEMAADGLVRVGVSVTTLDREIARTMEPRVPAPMRRLKTIRALADAGVEVRVMASPIIPGLTDHELEAILIASKECGAVAASTILLRLPHEVSGLFREWVTEHFPDRAERVMKRVRDTHGGKDYDAEWGKRLKGQGIFASVIRQRFEVTVRRLGLREDLPPLRTDLFSVPLRPGDQLRLF